MMLGIRRTSEVLFICAAAALLAQEHTATNGTNPLAGNPAAVAAGEKLYRQTCQACHGGQARGDRGPALATNNFAHGNDDADLFRNIRGGISGSAMPSFSKLTNDQTWQLISYIRSLSGVARVKWLRAIPRPASNCSMARRPAVPATR